jgi:hypothetical protein
MSHPSAGASLTAATAPATGPPAADATLGVRTAATPQDHATLSVLPSDRASDDADPLREHTGIKISLDGVGAVITARPRASNTLPAEVTPRTLEEGTADDKNVKTILQDVRPDSKVFIFLKKIKRKTISNSSEEVWYSRTS